MERDSEVEKAPLLGQGMQQPSPAPMSVFALPEQQALGGFGSPTPTASSSAAAQPRPASFSSASWQDLSRASQLGEDWKKADSSSPRSFRGGWTNPNVDANMMRYPSAPMSGPPRWAGDFKKPPMPQQPFPVMPMMPSMFPSNPDQSMMYPVNVDAGRHRNSQTKLVKPLPLLLKLVVVMSFVQLLICAPLGIWYGYILWISSSVLFAGPLAGALSMAAIYLSKWGCCGNRVKSFKFLITMAGVVDIAGAVTNPLVMLSAMCPPDGSLPSCEHDKHGGRGYSAAAALVMLVHAALCIASRFRANSINEEFLQQDADIPVVENTRAYRPPQYVGAQVQQFDPNRSFTYSVQYPTIGRKPGY